MAAEAQLLRHSHPDRHVFEMLRGQAAYVDPSPTFFAVHVRCFVPTFENEDGLRFFLISHMAFAFKLLTSQADFDIILLEHS